jgi:flagellar P-ring protein precursor FlgI
MRRASVASVRQKSRLAVWLLALALGFAWMAPAAAQTVRIKDIADFEGVRDNMLVGYGLVVGLNNTGDTLNKSIFTQQSLIGMLERLGVNARTANNDMRTRNLAAVMVTATLPAFAHQGTRVDINVASLGDATSLLGGTLLVTPLVGADGEVYAVGQGQLAIGGFVASGAAQRVTQGVPTSGRIANGALVEREVGFEMNSLSTIKIALRNPDFTTARRVSQAINAFLGGQTSHSIDPTTVVVQIPATYRGDATAMLTDIEQLPVEPDQIAKVVIDEKSGVIVVGEAVRISTVAVAQGNLTIRITETPQVSQPSPFAPGPAAIPSIPGQTTPNQVINVPQPRIGATGQPVLDQNGNPVFDLVPRSVPGGPSLAPVGGAIAGGAQTVVVPRTQIEVDQQSGRRLAVLPAGVTLGELVNGLNALGVGPRDLITILQTIKAAGALQAEIQVI